jgi:hypothetical protein
METPKYSAMAPLIGFVGDLEQVALYAGESCNFVNDIKPAAQIVQEVAREAEEVFEQLKRL